MADTSLELAVVLVSLLALMVSIAPTPAPACGAGDVACAERACTAKDASACDVAAAAYRTGKDVRADVARAGAYAESARLIRVAPPATCPECAAACHQPDSAACGALCKKGKAEACVAVGAQLMLEPRSADDAARGKKLLQPLCPAQPRACSLLGTTLMLSRADMAGAVALLEKGCAGHEPAACGTLGLMFISGQGVKQDVKRGAELLGGACQGRYWPACGTLGQAYENGDGVPQDEPIAIHMYEVACEGGGDSPHFHACFQVGTLYLQGVHTQKNEARGRQLLQKACDGGVQKACEAFIAP